MTETAAVETAKGASLRSLLRTWRYFFWLLGLGLLVMLFYAEENWRGRRAWEKYRQEAAGERFEADAFVPPPVEDSQNFAMTPSLAPLFDFFPGTQQVRDSNAVAKIRELTARYDLAPRHAKEQKTAMSNSWTTHSIDLQASYAGLLKRQILLQVSETNWTEVQAATGVLEALSDYAPLLEELRLASQRPRSRFNLRYDHEDPVGILLPHLSLLKQFCQVLKLRASAALALGRTEAAFSDVELIFFLSDATREEPCLISHLVRIAQLQLALQPLAQGMSQWSDAQLQTFQARLLRFNFPADVKWGLRAERSFFGGLLIDKVRQSPGHYAALADFRNSGGLVNAEALALTLAPRGWFDFEKLNYSRVFDQHLLPVFDLERMRISPDESRKASREIDELLNDPGAVLFLKHKMFAALLAPPISNLASKVAFGQTGAHCAAIACALERYRRSQGVFPESLQQLTPEFIPGLPHDIINGAPLKYRRTDDGRFVLYSVGWNQTDDGASISASKTSEPDAREGDWVWCARPIQD